MKGPLSQLLPVHSIWQFIIIRVALPGAHMKQNFVFVVKTLPLGTSGVWVVAVTEIDRSRSMKSRVSVMMHLQDLGPIEA